MHNFSKYVGVLASIALGVSPAFGTTLVRADVNELSETSDVVVRGTVKSLTPHWNQDRTRIFTDVEIQVSEALKGTAEQSLTVRQPGGVVGDIGQKVSGLATFNQGEDVVLFLQQHPGKRYDLNGLGQGKFRIQKSDDGKKLLAVPEKLDETLLLDPKSHKPVDPTTAAIDLDTLRQNLKAMGNSTRKTLLQRKTAP